MPKKPARTKLGIKSLKSLAGPKPKRVSRLIIESRKYQNFHGEYLKERVEWSKY